MTESIDTLLIDTSSANVSTILGCCKEAGAHIDPLRIETLEASMSVLDMQQVQVVLMELVGDDASLKVLERVLKHALSIPVVTFGPTNAALISIATGAEDHIPIDPLHAGTLLAILQTAIERRKRWKAIEVNETRLRTFIQASADGLVIVDDSGTVRFANRAAEQLLDCKSHELVGSLLGTPCGEDDIVELSIVRPQTNETIAAEMRVVEIEWGGKLGYIESIRDVSQQKLEAQKARDAIRMRDHFLATLSHELRNPLAALNNAAQVLSQEQERFPVLEVPVEIIQRQCHQMIRLLDDLLDISRISQGKVELRKESISLRKLIVDCLQGMRPRIEKSHFLNVQLSQDPLFVFGDPSRLQQVIVNLITNAVKYTSPGSEICIHSEQLGQEAVMQVSDRGHGIAPELLEAIFEPFVQAEQTLARSDGGLGIGLAVVRRFVELHGGRVIATSDGLGKGSQFTMYLPLSAPAVRESVQPPASDTSRFRICVIDDVPDIALMMRILLEKMGHEVTTAHDGVRGLELILSSPFDIAFLDIGLPGLSGYEVADRVVRDSRGQRVVLVAVSGYGQPEDRQRALDSGFHYHMVKPISISDLRLCLEEIAQK